MPAEPDVEVRRVVPGDWPALRALRLEMVQDTPVAFTERVEDLLALPDDAWRVRATRGSAGGDLCHLVAVAGGRLVGQALTSPREAGSWCVIGVYLQPSRRGQGLLARLLGGVAATARAGGATTLRLQVHEDNARAAAAYRGLGFVATGERTPYPLGPGEELTMELPLAGDRVW